MEKAAATPAFSLLGSQGVLPPSRAPCRTLKKVRVEGSSSRENLGKMSPTKSTKTSSYNCNWGICLFSKLFPGSSFTTPAFLLE